MSLNEDQIKALVRAEVRRIFDTGLMYTEEVKKPQQPKPAQPPAPAAPGSIQSKFSPELAAVLDFQQQGNTQIIKAKQFLGAEKFNAILAIVKDAGGKYISAGRDSHFEI